MSKDNKFYICVHDGCAFETAKRKAIYTHLVRTHSERKEDFECEYCSTVFEDEALVEDHLTFRHPDKQFTYTCVSRIENIINQCSKLGEDKKNGITVKKELTKGNKSKSEGLEDRDDTKDSKSSTFNRTKASVNESLNNLAAKNQTTHTSQSLSDSNKKIENGPSELISQPGSLKVKLNLKKIAECTSRESRELSTSPPKLEPESPRSDCYPDSSAGSPPDILPSQGPDCISVREKASKYFDRLEVYHTTDEHGRRCCPFCDYKTGKNTIRVHLAGIHKIYFVKCSLCEYKAAFPHQVTQHGVKFHKTTNLNVIQLSKESRERTIAKLNSLKKTNPANKPSLNYSLNSSAENSMDADMFEDDNFSDESSSVIEDDRPEPEANRIDDSSLGPEICAKNSSLVSKEVDRIDDSPVQDKVLERTYPAPKSQMAKTDYFMIKVVNGVHLYCCNFCNFTTHVRATIYTHKYRHEDDSYKCGYCDFTSSPRSNVVNHLRSRHKNKTIVVTLVDEAIGDENIGASESKQDGVIIKQENQTVSKFMEIMEPNTESENTDKPTIINVPQYKRTLTSAFNGDHVGQEGQSKRRKTEPDNYKLSLNKMYKVNPTGASPKYVCVECSYGCDTHPKMKHHLYRHRPQQYKCPYCDHRKYPRSYVVRHVRDTHRDKPVRVIDLSIGPEPIDIPEYMDDNDDEMCGLNEQNEEMDESNDVNGNQDHLEEPEVNKSVDLKKADKADSRIIKTESNINTDTNMELRGSYSETNDDMLSNSLQSTKSILDNLNQTPTLNTNFLDDSNDVNPNFSEAVYTSTPLIESLINGNFEANDVTPEPETKPTQKTPMFRKKSSKDYRINYGDGARYICNICNYQTENYKTIHNHMYRHDSQKYQCPYCGYRRSPKSFVENHIREVHRGHPLFVTELKDDLEHKVPMGSPRQCVMSQKKKEINYSLNQEKDELNLPNPSKLQIKWPAPKSASQVNITQPSCSNTSPLQIPVLHKAPNAVVVPNVPLRLSAPGNTGNLMDNRTNFLSSSVMPPNVSPFKTSTGINDAPRSTVILRETLNAQGIQSPGIQNPFKFKEPSRTTYKTMYKCVFDPETCNHISKDKSKMKQHLFMHVEYKPWSCDLCDMTASQSSHLRNHVRSEHHGASEMSFRYKKHNYLEKHIDTFLSKGLFTVPVNEFRMIMDMKGNTKKTYLTEYKRDSEGFLHCPHCDYKTKSASMTDHVKMKHMQPRFKCHWCNFKAFYRSEVRRHHKKERAHGHLEFKVQELDLKEVVDGLSGANTKDQTEEQIKEEAEEQVEQTNQILETDLGAESADLVDEQDEDGDTDEDDDDDDDASSSEDLSMYFDYSTGKIKHTDDTHEEEAVESIKRPEETVKEVLVPDEHSSTSERDDCENNVVPEISKTTDKVEIDASIISSTNAKFQCGYCSFSAALRVKVKMHCGKKHPDKELSVIEPFIRYQSDSSAYNGSNVMQVSCSELKGTKFEADLKRVGVSKLNLTSLFPSSYGQISHNRPQIHDEGKNVPERMQETDKANKPTTTIKKEEKSSKLDMLIMKLSKNKSAVDNDPEFKRPKDPVRPAKFFDKRKERKPTPVFTKENLTPGLNATKDDNEEQAGKDIIIQPLSDDDTEQLSDQTKPLEPHRTNSWECINENITNESVDSIPFKPESVPATTCEITNHNQTLYNDDGTELMNTGKPVQNHSDTIVDEVDFDVDNDSICNSNIKFKTVTDEKDKDIETDQFQDKINEYDNREPGIADIDAFVHKSLPNGSPVIRETETVEDDNLQDGAKSNELHGQLRIQASA